MNAATAARVWEAIQTLNFVPSTLARNLRMKSTQTIGVLSDYAGNPFFSEVVAGIEEVCFQRNYSVFVSFSELNVEKEAESFLNLERRGVEGLIWHAVDNDETVAELLQKSSKPVVMFQRYLDSWNHDALVTDDTAGGQMVMRHLLDLGHRRIALITGDTFSSNVSRLREVSYRSALNSAGVEVNPAWIRNGKYTYEGAYAATKALLTLEPAPTAFFCISDRMALGCLSAIQDAGLFVPRDVSLVGYDNLELLSYVRPRLTTVDHGGRESGRRMAQRLLDRITTPNLGIERLQVEPTLQVRETTGPAPL